MEVFVITDDFIQLNQLLKVMNWCESGAQANIAIEDGTVKVNGKKETRKRNKLYDGFVIEYNKQKVRVKKE